MATVVSGPTSAIPQPKVLSPNALLRRRELSHRCFVRPKVGRQLVVEPQQICIKPHMNNDVIRNYKIRGIGEVARLCGPPTGSRTEQGAVAAELISSRDEAQPGCDPEVENLLHNWRQAVKLLPSFRHPMAWATSHAMGNTRVRADRERKKALPLALLGFQSLSQSKTNLTLGVARRLERKWSVGTHGPREAILRAIWRDPPRVKLSLFAASRRIGLHEAHQLSFCVTLSTLERRVRVLVH